MKKFLLVMIVAAILDQLSKFIVKQIMPFTKNYGAAFGILQGERILLMFIAVIVLTLIIFAHYTNKKEFPAVATGLLAGGIIGNLVDRIFFGYVVDFIDLHWFPSFNLADSFNTIGVALLLWYSFKH